MQCAEAQTPGADTLVSGATPLLIGLQIGAWQTHTHTHHEVCFTLSLRDCLCEEEGS